MSRASGTAGMKAEPSCNRHAMSPTLPTAKLAAVPAKIPKAVYICQLITRAPRIGAIKLALICCLEAVLYHTRRVLGREDGDGAGLCPHTDTEKKTTSQKLFPCPRKCSSNYRLVLSVCCGGNGELTTYPNAKVGGEEDCSATTDPIVQWIGEPAADESRAWMCQFKIVYIQRRP